MHSLQKEQASNDEDDNSAEGDGDAEFCVVSERHAGVEFGGVEEVVVGRAALKRWMWYCDVVCKTGVDSRCYGINKGGESALVRRAKDVLLVG